MALSVGDVQSLTTKGIRSEGGVLDAIFKNHAYLSRLKAAEGVYSGEKMTFPFFYKDDTTTTGKFYQGGESLAADFYESITELSFDLIELEETLKITHRDLARNSGKEARLKLLENKLKGAEMGMRQRFTKGIFSDGTASTGALTAKQFPGFQAFMKSSAVTYGGVTNTDVSVHVASVNDNSGTDRALTTALDQNVLGNASEGNESPTLRIMRQNVMNEFIELIKPHQRTTREGSLDGLGHSKNTLVYSGVDSIVDNLSPAQQIQYINEKFVKLYSHPEYNMKTDRKSNLEDTDALQERIFWKGVFANSVLRYAGVLKDIQVS